MILPPAFIAAQIKPAFSPRKAEAIRRLGSLNPESTTQPTGNAKADQSQPAA